MHAFPKHPETLLPHRPPLLLLDAVDGVDKDGAWGSLTLRPGHVFLNGQGVLERVAFAEIMAQCFAAFGAARQAQGAAQGASQELDNLTQSGPTPPSSTQSSSTQSGPMQSGPTPPGSTQNAPDPAPPAVGYLAALRDVRVLGDAYVGDVLHASARATATLGGITVVEGEVRRGDDVLARGQCKIFVPPTPPAESAARLEGMKTVEDTMGSKDRA